MKQEETPYGISNVLESGRVFSTRGRLLGLQQCMDDEVVLSDGSGDSLCLDGDPSRSYCVIPLTLAERREVAADVIAQWVAWAEDER